MLVTGLNSNFIKSSELNEEITRISDVIAYINSTLGSAGLIFNTYKTLMMLISNKLDKNCIKHLKAHIKVNSKTIDLTSEIKYLGVVFDEERTKFWKTCIVEHINN